MPMPPEYGVWYAMIYRCYNQKAEGWKYYGGRWIKVCDRWRYSFENFLADMGPRPQGLTIDRYPDGNGNYEPTNCRWATRLEQIETRRPRNSAPERNSCYVIEDFPLPDDGHYTRDGVIFLAREHAKYAVKSRWATEMGITLRHLCAFLDGKRKPHPAILKALGFNETPYYRKSVK